MRRTLNVQEDPQTGDLFIELPDDVLEAAGLAEGDTIKWTKGHGESWVLSKADNDTTLE
jgi:hypothetical protein